MLVAHAQELLQPFRCHQTLFPHSTSLEYCFIFKLSCWRNAPRLFKRHSGHTSFHHVFQQSLMFRMYLSNEIKLSETVQREQTDVTVWHNCISEVCILDVKATQFDTSWGSLQTSFWIICKFLWMALTWRVDKRVIPTSLQGYALNNPGCRVGTNTKWKKIFIAYPGHWWWYCPQVIYQLTCSSSAGVALGSVYLCAFLGSWSGSFSSKLLDALTPLSGQLFGD